MKLTASYPDTVPNAWNNLGLLATREGRTNDAIGYFEQALRARPDYWIALENLGNAYRQQKRWDDARATLERAVAARPQSAEANYSLAMVYAQIGDTDRAYEYLQNALKLRPDYPEALNNLGILYLRTRRRDDAVAQFQECIRVAPAFDQSYLNLARVYSLEGDRDKARAVLLDLLQQHPSHPQAQKALDELRCINSMPRAVIIDTDPSPDDAVAFLTALASPEELEVLAITTVAGNVPVHLTSKNARKALELARKSRDAGLCGRLRPTPSTVNYGRACPRQNRTWTVTIYRSRPLLSPLASRPTRSSIS